MAHSVGYRVRVHVQGELCPTWWSDVFADLVVAAEPGRYNGPERRGARSGGAARTADDDPGRPSVACLRRDCGHSTYRIPGADVSQAGCRPLASISEGRLMPDLDTDT
jgi:hypothetical protein